MKFRFLGLCLLFFVSAPVFAQMPPQAIFPELHSFCKVKLEHMARDQVPMDSCRPCFANCVIENKNRDIKSMCMEVCDMDVDYSSTWSDMTISNREQNFCKECMELKKEHTEY